MSPTSDSAGPKAPDALPTANTRAGSPRRVGVEVEFSGVTEETVARRLVECLGGTVSEDPANHHWIVSDSAIGGFECYLDSRPLEKLDQDNLGRHLRDLARSVVPVEIVSDPIKVSDIAQLDKALVDLRDAGATGTRAGILLGFGVHFNPEAVSTELRDVLPVLTAYALIEDHLRRLADIDMARRLLPWVDPYPRALVDALAAETPPQSMAALIDTYLDHAPSRNHGLDMLCLFAEADRDRVARVMEMTQISARPTYHLRLPDCRIDEADWSLAKEWSRWVLVEKVAADDALMERLKAAWRKHRSSFTTLRGDWAQRCAALLNEADL